MGSDSSDQTIPGYDDVELGSGTRDTKIIWSEHRTALILLVVALLLWAVLIAFCGFSINFPILGFLTAIEGLPFSFFFALLSFVSFVWFLFYFVGSTCDASFKQMMTCFLFGIVAMYLALALQIIVLIIFNILMITVYYGVGTASGGNADLVLASFVEVFSTICIRTPIQVFCFWVFLRLIPKHTLSNRFSGALYGLSFGVGFSIAVAVPAISVCGAVYSSFIVDFWSEFFLTFFFVITDYSFFSVALNVATGVWIGWALNFNKFSPSPLQPFSNTNFGKWYIQVVPAFVIRVIYLLASSIPVWWIGYIYMLPISIAISTITSTFSGTSIEFYLIYFHPSLWMISFSVGVVTVIFTVCLILYLRRVSLMMYSNVASSADVSAQFEDL